jgi:ABC-type branched-subunit amino acid transport system ATPase component
MSGAGARKPGEPVLSVANASVSYRGGAIEALNDVSIAVHPAEIVVLLGPNGAGKTTMLRTITGLLPFNGGRLTSGSVTFEGKRIDGRPDWSIVRGGIGLVMEGRRIFARLSVEDNLRAGGITASKAAYKENYDKVMSLFPRLAERRSVAGGMLSGGEQQMLAMGRALMQSPGCCCLTSRRSGSHRWWWSRSGRSSSTSTPPGRPWCSSSRTRRWRCRSPITATSWSAAGSGTRAVAPACSATSPSGTCTWA